MKVWTEALGDNLKFYIPLPPEEPEAGAMRPTAGPSWRDFAEIVTHDEPAPRPVQKSAVHAEDDAAWMEEEFRQLRAMAAGDEY